ncbi:MAG TPA: DivIVA domain-containing protein [Acidimicrobiales bacterium]|nr:DivIVA domain-containing protein [Acidimicrobiales bacterium]
MSSPEEPASTQEPSLEPEDVSQRSFATAFRGFDPVEVRAFLGQVSDELRAARERESELRRQLEASPADREPEVPGSADDGAGRLAEAEAAAAETRSRAEAEAAAVVDGARQEAERLVREAKERVAQLGQAASAETSRLLEEARQQAQQVVRAKGEEAEGVAVKKLADAEREAAAIRVKAREEGDAILEAAKERGREMVAEAQAARERMISDLNRRKRAAAAQLDQLRAGRDRLLESLRVIRRNLDEITTRLEATEGVSAPVAETPEAPAVPAGAVEASGAGSRTTGQPDPGAPAPESPSVRPARATRVVLGELPPTRRSGSPDQARHEDAPVAGPPARPAGAAAPPAAARPPAAPRIDAPHARAAAGQQSLGSTGAEPAPATASPPATEPPEERRSSALRILRRNRGSGRPERNATPVQVGRDSPGEGVRIIAKEPEPGVGGDAEREAEVSGAPPEHGVVAAESAGEPEAPEVPDAPPAGSAVEADVEADVDVDVEAEETEAVDAAATTPPEADQPAAVAPPAHQETHADRDDDPGELPEPLRPEELRPRIEDLFAKLRAEREGSAARARTVLAEGDDGAEDAGEETGDAADLGPATDVAPASDPSGAQEGGGEGGADADEHLLQRRDSVLDPLVGQLARRLKRAIQDEQNATLDRLRTARAHPSEADVLPSPETQPASYRYAALPFLEEAARSASSTASFGAVAVGVDDLAQTLADDIAQQLRVKVARVLVDADGEGVDVQTVSERVSSVYREWKTQKVESLAIHHLVAAWSRGIFVATPEGTAMRWVVDDDGPCPDCDDNALAGPTPRGEPFPTGQLYPPAHPGCRCLFVRAHG